MRRSLFSVLLLVGLLGGCTIPEPGPSTLATEVPLPSVEPLPTAEASNGPTDELAQPTITLEPIETNLQATDIAREPTATFEPLLANTFPQGSEFHDTDGSLAFQTVFPDNTPVESVTFEVFDGDTQVYQRVDQNAPYCAFGEQEDICNAWHFVDNNNQWPGGVEVKDGATYRLVATSRATDGRTQVDTLTFVILLS